MVNSHNGPEGPSRQADGRNSATSNWPNKRPVSGSSSRLVEFLSELITRTIREEIKAAFSRMVPDDAVPPAARMSLTPEQVSKYCGIPLQTLANWRHRRIGPRYSKEGSKILYPVTEIKAWLERNMQQTNQSPWD